MDILRDVVVVEFSTGIAGPYAGKLFADAGAQVFKIEPPGGDPERHRPVGGHNVEQADAPLFRHLNASKRSIVGAPGDPAVDDLVSGADIVIESFLPACFDVEGWRTRRPALVILSITPFGRSGPWIDRPATGFTLQAESGSIGGRGRKDRVPFQAGGRLSEWSGGVFGAVGALAALMRARETGMGEHVDCSLLAADHMITNGNVCVRHSVLGHPPTSDPARIVDVPCIERTSDGFIGFNTNTRQQLVSFLAMVGRTDLLDDPRWASAEYRLIHAEEWNAQVRPWIRAHSTAEVMEAAAALRIPVAPVNNGKSLLDQEQFVSRHAIGPHPDGTFVHPQPPYRIKGERPRVSSRAPLLDEHAGSVVEPRVKGLKVAARSKLPFEGLRVLDATSMWAGPVVGQVFAALGADVIHLESVQRLDLSRLKVDNASTVPQWWERGHTWFMVNWNKRDLTLDLTDRRGREIVEALLPSCDVLVENYSPRVFEKFGLTAERVLEINPEIVFTRMPAFGLDGPWRDYIGFAQTMEQMSGLAWLTGHIDDDAPQVPRGPCDPLAGYHALFATFLALMRRREGLGGSLVEAAMAESALNAAAECLVDYSALGVLLERTGNRSPDAVPQGLFPCRGDEQWLALSVEDDQQWVALRQVLGDPRWAESSELATAAGRHSAHDFIDAHLAAWAAKQSLIDAVDALIAAGIPAGSVTDPRFADSHPQLNAFGYFEEIDHPILGTHRAPTLPFRFASVERWVRSPAPLLGQHNLEVLREIAHLDEDAIALLERDLVIGTSPLESNPSFDM